MDTINTTLTKIKQGNSYYWKLDKSIYALLDLDKYTKLHVHIIGKDD